MKIPLATLKVGDVISVDCGYHGMSSMEDVTVLHIEQSIDLWDKQLTQPCVTVRDGNGEVFSLIPDIFS